MKTVAHPIDLDEEETSPPELGVSDDEDEAAAPKAPSVGEQDVDTDLDKAFLAGQVSPNDYVCKGLGLADKNPEKQASMRKVMSAAGGWIAAQTINPFSAV